jgi:ABC-type polysaccharide/polyol phosphate export permease
VRFAQTKAGGIWLVGQPLLSLGVYTLIFSRITNKGVNVPYPLFALAGLTAWLFVSRTLSSGAASLVANSNILKKVACPRIFFPLSTVIAGTVDFVVALLLYFALGGVYGRVPRWEAVYVLPLWCLAFALTLGLVLILAPLQARYRDVSTMLTFVVQLWFFLSPIAYVLPKLGAKADPIVQFNPIAGIVSGFRAALIGTPLDTRKLLIAIVVSLGFLVVGVLRFNAAEQTVADDL